MYTEDTTLTRLHVVEDAISQVQSKLSSIDSKFDAIFQALVASSQATRPIQLESVSTITPSAFTEASPLGLQLISPPGGLHNQSSPTQFITPSTLSTLLGKDAITATIQVATESLTTSTYLLPSQMDIDASIQEVSPNLSQHILTGAGPLSGNQE